MAACAVYVYLCITGGGNAIFGRERGGGYGIRLLGNGNSVVEPELQGAKTFAWSMSLSRNEVSAPAPNSGSD
jgi:hypothetical protein